MRKVALTAIAAVLLVLVLITPAQAVHLDLSDARIDANAQGLYVEKIEQGGFFVKRHDLGPGDTIRRAYRIGNTYSYDYDLYLHAENAENEPEDRDLLHNIFLRLTLDGTEIYNGTVAGETDASGKTMENEIYLGRIGASTASRLQAEFRVEGPGLDNSWQQSKARVDWVFRAVRKDRPVTPATPKTPKTGDLVQIGIVLTIMLVALIAILAAKRRDRTSRMDT